MGSRLFYFENTRWVNCESQDRKKVSKACIGEHTNRSSWKWQGGGGVELTTISLIKGLVSLGHELILLAPDGSSLPPDCLGVDLQLVSGIDQPSWQHQDHSAPLNIPLEGVLPKLWEKALLLGKNSDAVLNFGYDWLPIWLTSYVDAELFHLISMGGVSQIMQNLIRDISLTHHSRLAFHTQSQALDYELTELPTIVGNGFDLDKYQFQPNKGGPLGWAGRISPEKGLEDAVSVAAAFKEKLLVWGFVEDPSYASEIEKLAPPGTINWRGFLHTEEFQKELGKCRALINTPKWNEAYGNVVVEAMACGVPVVAYGRGGPGELVNSGETGWLVSPDDIAGLIEGISRVGEIDRKKCRLWTEEAASSISFAKRIETWIFSGLQGKQFINS